MRTYNVIIYGMIKLKKKKHNHVLELFRYAYTTSSFVYENP